MTVTNNEVELISDGDGLAVIGPSTAVERFMESVGLSKVESKSIRAALGAGSSVAQAGSVLAADSGRWVKLTEESAQAVKQFGLTPTKTPGVSHAMVGQPGDIKQWIQIVKSPGSMVTNPAMLAGAAGVMAQIAMQQQMDAIMDYLARIDEKLDSVLRAQTNQVLARMDGVALAVQEAASVRNSVGRVSEITCFRMAGLLGGSHGVPWSFGRSPSLPLRSIRPAPSTRDARTPAGTQTRTR